MICLKAYAKLNLYLRVLGRRPDGYHDIETVFERIDLADELTIQAEPRRLQLTCDQPDLPCGEENLIIRAGRLLQQACGTQQGAEMQLTKRIPIAAGLGGGSSDAAAALHGLNELWELGLDQTRLGELAATLGSDVPFFLQPEAVAIGQGRGEVCRPLPKMPELVHVLVVPPGGLSTHEIYSKAQFDLTAPKPSITMVLHALRNGSLGELAKGFFNDLEPEAIRRCPRIQEIHSHLRDGGCMGTLLSGSGPAVFGLCRDLGHAQEVAGQLRAHRTSPWRVFVVKTAHRPIEARGRAPVRDEGVLDAAD